MEGSWYGRQVGLVWLQDAPLSRSGASLKCSKLHGPSTVLLGDAGHSVTPALGQGCAAALEDCVVFAQVTFDTLLASWCLPFLVCMEGGQDAPTLHLGCSVLGRISNC